MKKIVFSILCYFFTFTFLVYPINMNATSIMNEPENVMVKEDVKKSEIIEETDEYIIYDDYSIEGKLSPTTDSNRRMLMFAHLNSINVSEGQSLSAGVALGVMWETGDADGKHVHLELWDGYITSVPICSYRINPNSYLNVFNSAFIISQNYNTYDSRYACDGYHKGTDIVLSGSDETVISPVNGIVRSAVWGNGSFGNYVVIEITSDAIALGDIVVDNAGLQASVIDLGYSGSTAIARIKYADGWRSSFGYK